MIWMGGRVVPEAKVTVGVADRTLEHGIGLFETLRTWERKPVLLSRHLERMRRSAEALALPFHGVDRPDAGAIAALLEANGIEGDALLRITLTGGDLQGRWAVLWMRSGPLPPPTRRGGAILVLGECPVAWDDPLARHKSLNYWTRLLAHQRALGLGADEALTTTPDGRVWEGSRTNLFVVHEGVLMTPGLDGPLVPGVMRALVLERARALGLEVREADLTTAALDDAAEVFLTNAVRGIVPVGQTPGRLHQAPGPVTRTLRDAIRKWLVREELP